jgi:hypothetical protein
VSLIGKASTLPDGPVHGGRLVADIEPDDNSDTDLDAEFEAEPAARRIAEPTVLPDRAPTIPPQRQHPPAP